MSSALTVLVLWGCAHVEAPAGGPEMREPLTIVEVRPDTMAVVPGLRGPVVFGFERRLSERGLRDAVLVSPRTSTVEVSQRGRVLRVSLREGWEPHLIYQVTVLPGIQDLWNNRLETPMTHVFSTGARIPDTRLDGIASDRITGRPEVGIRVEAVRAVDSLVYATLTDSVGGFLFKRIPEGQYRVRAFRDMNRNRELDPFEPRDTAPAVVAAEVDTETLRLRVVMPDTTPPRVTSAQLMRQLIEVQFDDYLDPEQVLSPAQVTLVDAVGSVVPVRRLAVGRLAAAPERGDEPEGGAVPPQAAPAAPATPAPTDPGAAAPAELLPAQMLVVEPAAPLAPESEYRIIVEGVRNVVGLIGGGEATLTTPAPPPAPTPDGEGDPPAN